MTRPAALLARPLALPLLALPLALLLAGCGSGGEVSEPPVAGPSAAAGTVEVEVGSVGRVRAEVADDDAERASGLMGRSAVPAGTGMVFRYPAPVEARFYMYRVPIPLTAVFARDGRVVGISLMPPCPFAEPQDCPTYGPEQPFDTVLETAPATVAGKVRVGDTLRVFG
jgi:uncharacterized membrane protein (UPF0127 family)